MGLTPLKKKFLDIKLQSPEKTRKQCLVDAGATEAQVSMPTRTLGEDVIDAEKRIEDSFLKKLDEQIPDEDVIGVYKDGIEMPSLTHQNERRLAADRVLELKGHLKRDPMLEGMKINILVMNKQGEVE